MKKIFSIYDLIEERVLVGSLAFTVILIFAQVIMRKFFNNSLSWSEELARFIFIWQIWLGISLGARKKEHIVVEMLYSVVKGVPARVLRVFVLLLNILFCLFMVVMGWQVTKNLMLKGTLSPAMEIPLWIVYASLPFSFLVTMIRHIAEPFEKRRSADPAAAENGGE